MISIVTPTGGRPEAFKLCQEWISRQSGPRTQAQWIVIDDCEPQTEIGIASEIIRPDEKWVPGTSTQGRNLLLGFQKCKGDYITVMEDDDYYAPQYLEMMLQTLRSGPYQMVGAAKRRYYHLPTKSFKRFYNVNFSSLAQTMFSREVMEKIAIPLLEKGESITFDVSLWGEVMAQYRKRDYLLFESEPHAVGIKGMPGRPGLTGHRVDHTWFRDNNLSKLKSWLGDDWFRYSEFLGK